MRFEEEYKIISRHSQAISSLQRPKEQKTFLKPGPKQQRNPNTG